MQPHFKPRGGLKYLYDVQLNSAIVSIELYCSPVMYINRLQSPFLTLLTSSIDIAKYLLSQSRSLSRTFTALSPGSFQTSDLVQYNSSDGALLEENVTRVMPNVTALIQGHDSKGQGGQRRRR